MENLLKQQDSKLTPILERFRTQTPNILQTLLAMQEDLGYVPPDAVPDIAHSLRVTEADVAGVLAFYPHLQTRPPGRHLVRVCLGESCVANRGGRTLTELRDHLKIDLGETTPDGRFTLERVYCLGELRGGADRVSNPRGVPAHGRIADTGRHDTPFSL